jgi:uncharacterized protein YcfL
MKKILSALSIFLIVGCASTEQTKDTPKPSLETIGQALGNLRF